MYENINPRSMSDFSPHRCSLQLLKKRYFPPHVSLLFICRFCLDDLDTFPASFHDLVMIIIILPFLWNPLSISPYCVCTMEISPLIHHTFFTTLKSLLLQISKPNMSDPKCCDCEWLKALCNKLQDDLKRIEEERNHLKELLWKSYGSWAEKEQAVEEDIISASEEVVNDVDDGYMDDKSLAR